MQITRYGLVVATVLGLLSFATPHLAQAATYTINFSLSSSGPQNPFAGSFSYTAVAPEGPIQSLTDINLTVDGHAYTLAEVSFLNPSGGGGSFADFATIFATSDGTGVPNSGAKDDFFLVYHPVTLDLGPGLAFLYTTANFSVPFGATAGELSLSEVAPVPLPAAIVLFSSGLGLIGLLARRRRRSKALA